MDEVQRFASIQEKTNKASEVFIRLEERLKTNMSKLETMIKSIQDKGYDPTKLADTKNAKSAELNQILDTLEKEINDITEKLKDIEVATNA
jgi:molybdopterin converting factor small subunit